MIIILSNAFYQAFQTCLLVLIASQIVTQALNSEDKNQITIWLTIKITIFGFFGFSSNTLVSEHVMIHKLSLIVIESALLKQIG